MPGTCVFCGAIGKLTGEHVLGDWLNRIGLELDPVVHRTGWLNRIGRDVGVTPPFHRKVRDVCGPCNHGWMSRLEAVARRVLTPFILGEPGSIERADQGAIAAWLQKSVLVAMLVSSEDERAGGYGLPPEEYHQLYERHEAMEPLAASMAWIGRYGGERRLASTWVTPLVVTTEGTPEPDRPQGYAMTILLGQLILHGVRFTTPSLQVEVSTEPELPQLWPVTGPVAWPVGVPVDDAVFPGFAGGKGTRLTERHIEVRPWKAATELAQSQLVGSVIELPTICGKHVAYYPAVLAAEAMLGRFHAFLTSCACGTAYLVETEADGAHCKLAGEPSAIAERYEALSGEEIVIEDESGSFWSKRLPGRPDGVWRHGAP